MWTAEKNEWVKTGSWKPLWNLQHINVRNFLNLSGSYTNKTQIPSCNRIRVLDPDYIFDYIFLLKYIFVLPGPVSIIVYLPMGLYLPLQLVPGIQFAGLKQNSWKTFGSSRFFFFKTSFQSLPVLFSSPLRLLLLFPDHAVVANSGFNAGMKITYLLYWLANVHVQP